MKTKSSDQVHGMLLAKIKKEQITGLAKISVRFINNRVAVIRSFSG
jgi:hypothetical protein